ncbi:hypothetical protein EG68_04039 [Paragonimus skrjabini miyazakii]|uniref:Uncharacterized protein n=1 Tax=Paragonimus skrjabini miyazakii TaxID=59628 RepID=A0A8S9Z649_9TREM|nr:hypothetical protein EG68_04039 [Paragonimus skrjabini miyazakii]
MMNNVMAYINSSRTPQSQPTVSYSHGKFHLPMRDLEIFLKMNNDMDNEEVYKDFVLFPSYFAYSMLDSRMPSTSTRIVPNFFYFLDSIIF